ncbi:LamG-like jellyroll fold domain-containing protein [Nocardioides convexus]|uniref:LamG-like jellyroll fold domain-containing protein n=1 Tax=Nocardioides convexus TaxID=2712224 RepID=UPI003100E1F2
MGCSPGASYATGSVWSDLAYAAGVPPTTTKTHTATGSEPERRRAVDLPVHRRAQRGRRGGQPEHHRQPAADLDARVMIRAATGLLLVALAAAGVPAAGAGWTAAQVANPTDTARTGRLTLTHTWGSSACAGTGPADAACSGAPLPSGASTAATQTQVDTLSNTTPSGTYTQQVQVLSCAPARFTNAGTAADPMLPRYGVTRAAADPWGTSVAAGFDGSTHYAADVVPTTTSLVAGGSYSIGLWFRAPAGSGGGGLLSLNASPVASTSAGANPTLYLDAAGRVRVKLDGTPVLVLPVILVLASASGTDLRDGRWHHVALTVNRKTLTTDLKPVRRRHPGGLHQRRGAARRHAERLLVAPGLDRHHRAVGPRWPAGVLHRMARRGVPHDDHAVRGERRSARLERLRGVLRQRARQRAAPVDAGRSRHHDAHCRDRLRHRRNAVRARPARLGARRDDGLRAHPARPGSPEPAGFRRHLRRRPGRARARPSRRRTHGWRRATTPTWRGSSSLVPLAHRVSLAGSAWTLRFDWGVAVLLG